MKTFATVTFFILFVVPVTKAQTDSLARRQGYQTWISVYDDTRSKVGILNEIKDSSVTIRNLIRQPRFGPAKPGTTATGVSTIDIRSIDVIKVRKKGAVARGVLFGALAGVVLGGAIDLIYYSSWKSTTPDHGSNPVEGMLNVGGHAAQFGVNAALIGVACLGAGMGIGAAVGSARIAIPINGSKKQFKDSRATLNDYSSFYRPDVGKVSFSKLRDSIVDADGNIYQVIALGAQVWMAENLKVTRFRDGTKITGMTKKTPNTGALYNFEMVKDERQICPAGWHVPSINEWTSLFSCLGGVNGAGKRLEDGFSAAGPNGQWWSSSEQTSGQAQSFYLNNESVGVAFLATEKTFNLSVRCIRD
jgi:hypothetical protein